MLSDFFSSSGWLWEPILKELTSQGIGLAKSQWKKIRSADAIRKYQERMRELHSTTRVLGNPHPIEIEGIYTDILIYDQPLSLRRNRITELKSEINQSGSISGYKERVDALNYIKKHNHLFILGKPGAGKTTLLKHLVINATNTAIDKTPIFVSLRDWTQTDIDFIDYIERQFDICEFPDAKPFIEILFQKGNILLLLDGLDEVNEENGKRKHVVQHLVDFTNKYPKNKFIITCRTAALDFSFEKFTYVEIADFTDQQAKTFVRKWFSKKTAMVDKMLVEINSDDKRNLRELAKTPILLALLCLNFEETSAFPLRRVEIYEEAIDALLKRWDSSRNIMRDEIYHGLSHVRKRQLLAHIATHYYVKNEILFKEDDLSLIITKFMEKISGQDISNQNIGEHILKAIEAQHGLLIQQAQGIYSFSHLTFQEYFTARQIADNAHNKALEWLLTKKLTDQHWREIALLTSSLLSNPEIFLTAFHNKINQLLQINQKLKDFNEWADQKARNYQNIENIIIQKIMAIELAIEIEVKKYCTTNNDFSLEKSIKQERARTVDKNMKNLGDKSKFVDEISTIDRDQEYSLDRSLTRLYVSSIDRSSHIDIKPLLNAAVEISRRKPKLFVSLASLRPPEMRHTHISYWDSFLQELSSALIEHQNIGHEWMFNKDELMQINLFIDYTVLLLECIEISMNFN